MAKILVADDNSNIQKMVGLALKDQGIDVVAVGNGEAAVRKISDVHPDLVLADVFMPVRNGYEVCRYVKEDSSLSHIPVILLVGAFDPLDEQEAQRVGADGVLKKPFVPPDPLISMVKSALAKAGVPLGKEPVAEKPVPAASRSAADFLSPAVGSKLAALSAEKLPEVTPEPIEEFAAPREQLKIAEGQGPVAFGNLLDTKEEEDVAVFSSKPMIELAKKPDWDDEPQDVAEEDEDASLRNGWRPDTLEEAEHAASSLKNSPDWREDAFHGNSPAISAPAQRWTTAVEHADLAEVASLPAAAVSTLETKPAGAALPFTGDAWAAAMAAGVEEKIAELKDSTPAIVEPEAVAHPPEHLPEELPGTVAASLSGLAEPAESLEETKPTEPANWTTIPESSWEVEAKRASLLASTWDVAPPAEQTQEVSSYASEAPALHTDAPVETSDYAGHPGVTEEVAAPASEQVSEPAAVEAGPQNWTAPVVAPPAVVEEAHVETAQAENYVAEPLVAQETAAPTPELNMDELVARVLGKLNPDVLQKVTREILKPVVEAIIRDELDSKKS